MAMRWSVIVLIVVGLLAALSASLLVAALATRNGTGGHAATPHSTVILATRKLEPMTVIEPDLVRKETVPTASRPQGCFSEPVQVVGRMLAMPVTEGQALTENVFAPQGPGFVMAANLPKGQRAVTVSLPISASMRGLLYPGSVVDVVVSFKLQNTFQQASLGEAVSTTILEGLQVLAVEDQTVGGTTTEKNAAKTTAASQAAVTNRCLVTLKVDPHQAEALQLASEYGAVSLALRNPTDGGKVDQNPTLLHQGRLAQMASLLKAMADAQRAKPEPAEKPKEVKTQVQRKEPRAAPQWQVEVIRGCKRETQAVALH